MAGSNPSKWAAQIERLRSLDLANPVLDRPRVEAAIAAFLAGIDIPAKPVDWLGNDKTPAFVFLGHQHHHGLLERWNMHDLAGRGSPAFVKAPEYLLSLGDKMTLAWQMTFGSRSSSATPFDLGQTVQIWARWVAAGDNRRAALLQPLADAFEAGAWALWVTSQQARLLERPVIRTNHQGEIHCADGPAILFPQRKQGAIYAWRGVQVASYVILDPKKIDHARVHGAATQGEQHVLMERYKGVGIAALIQDWGIEPHGKPGKYGTLYVFYIAGEPVAFVEVVNASPEPDGSFRRYFIRVPPNRATSPREAVAWSFGFENAEGYAPTIQT